MHKTAAIAIGCIVLALIWASSSGNQPADGMTTPDDTTAQLFPTPGGSGGGPRAFPSREETIRPVAQEPLPASEEPEQPVPDDHDEPSASLAEIFAAFNSKSVETASGEPQVTLDHFGRPYVMTMTEAGFAQLSPADKGTALGEIVKTLRQTRRDGADTYAQAEADMAGGHYDSAEGALVSEYERTGDFNANEEGLYLTRIIAASYQQRTLKRLETLYTRTGDHGKLQTTQQRWQNLESQKRQMQAAQMEQAD